ncbi:hypothetical protein [Actinophytocola sp.]
MTTPDPDPHPIHTEPLAEQRADFDLRTRDQHVDGGEDGPDVDQERQPRL